jgi:hypothetical protein
MIWSTSLIAFFLVYGWMLADDFGPRFPYDPVTGDGEFVVANGILSIILTTAVLMAPLVMAIRRWTLIPAGTATLSFTVVTLLVAVGFDRDLSPLPAAVLGGLTVDLLIRVGRSGLVAGIAPLVMWSAYFIAVDQVERGVQWQPELWGGAIFFAALTGLAIDGLVMAGRRLAELSPESVMTVSHR